MQEMICDLKPPLHALQTISEKGIKTHEQVNDKQHEFVQVYDKLDYCIQDAGQRLLFQHAKQLDTVFLLRINKYFLRCFLYTVV